MWKCKTIGLALILTTVLTLTTVLRAPTTSAGETGAGETGEKENPVIVELFTSQGCSSCPPADRILRRLISKGLVSKDRPVIPLSFHVDYWNYIGWTDPFSSARYSQRQQRYAAALRTGRSYTPQLVVDGQRHCVGSHAKEAQSLIAEARQRPRRGTVEIRVGWTADEGIVVDLVAEGEGIAQRDDPGALPFSSLADVTLAAEPQ